MWTWDCAPPARKEFLTLPKAAVEALVAFMEEVIGDDRDGIRQAAAKADPGGVMRRLAFGSAGLVTVVIHVRGKHVQVVMIQWAG